jgi:hypothetical protein
MSFKVHLGDEIRRFALEEVTYNSLETKIKQLFSLTIDFQLRYRDQDGDFITFSTDHELRSVLRIYHDILQIHGMLVNL